MRFKDKTCLKESKNLKRRAIKKTLIKKEPGNQNFIYKCPFL